MKYRAYILSTLLLAALPGISFAQTEPFIGEIRWVGFNFAPRGWAHCDGQLLPINQYTALFSLLGTTYGGDGRTTFGLPDMRGRVIIHPGNGPGLSSYRWGQRGGSEQVTLTTDHMAAHSHALVGTEETANNTSPTNNRIAAKQRTKLFSDSTASTANLDSASIGNTGGGQPHENRPPYLANYCIIALQGIYPSRN